MLVSRPVRLQRFVRPLPFQGGAHPFVVRQLPLVVGEAFGASRPLRSSCVPHLDRMLLLEVGGGFVQVRRLVVRGGRAQVDGQRVPAARRCGAFAPFQPSPSACMPRRCCPPAENEALCGRDERQTTRSAMPEPYPRPRSRTLGMMRGARDAVTLPS